MSKSEHATDFNDGHATGVSVGRRSRRAPRWLVIVAMLAVGTACGAVMFTFQYAEGLSYLSDDPGACINCHVMQAQYDGWLHGSHHATASCNDCHVPHDSVIHKYLVKAEHGYRHSKGFTFNDFHEPIQITPASRDVVIDNCRRCHESIAADTTVFADGDPHAADADGLGTAGGGGAECVHCHARVGHGPTR